MLARPAPLLKIRLERLAEPDRVIEVPALRDVTEQPTRFGPMRFYRTSRTDSDGLPVFSVNPRHAAPLEFTDRPPDVGFLPAPPEADTYDHAAVEARFASVGYGIGSSGNLIGELPSIEDEERDARLAKARKARAAVKDPFGMKRKAQRRLREAA